MLSGTDEPECLQRQRSIPADNLGVVGGADGTTPMPVAILSAADDAPDRRATKAPAHATIHSAVTAGRERFVTATQTDVGACGATDRANSTALNVRGG
jgi:hypothetical protein